MRTPAPALLPIFRSRLQGELLASVLLESGRPQTISELARRLGAPVATVQREVDRLARADLLHTERIGRARFVSANDDNPSTAPLRELVLITFGPASVVAGCFADVTGISELHLFGSWAARYRGESGSAPGDVDVLIVGTPDRQAVFGAADLATKRLHREVNATVVTAERWADPDVPFLVHIRDRPLVQIDHTDGEAVE